MAAMPTNVIVGGIYFVQIKPDNQYGINLMAKSISYCMHAYNTSYCKVTCLYHILYDENMNKAPTAYTIHSNCMTDMHGRMHPN